MTKVAWLIGSIQAHLFFLKQLLFDLLLLLLQCVDILLVLNLHLVFELLQLLTPNRLVLWLVTGRQQIVFLLLSHHDVGVVVLVCSDRVVDNWLRGTKLLQDAMLTHNGLACVREVGSWALVVEVTVC